MLFVLYVRNYISKTIWFRVDATVLTKYICSLLSIMIVLHIFLGCYWETLFNKWAFSVFLLINTCQWVCSALCTLPLISLGLALCELPSPSQCQRLQPRCVFLRFPILVPCPVVAVYYVRVLGVAEARETFLPLQLDTKITQRPGD